MTRTVLKLLAGLALVLCTAPLGAQTIAGAFLDFDSGGHRATVRDIVFLDDAETLVSISEDKTARIWDWQAGVTLNVLRGQIGPANEGKMLALAAIPGTQLIATGGFFAGPYSGVPFCDIRLFDRQTGKLAAVLGGLDLPVFGLATTADGMVLAGAGQNGVVQLWQRVESDWREGLRLDAGTALRDVGFVMDGAQIVAIGAAGGTRLWSAEGDVIPLSDMAPTAQIALTISPKGRLFATSDADGVIEVRSAGDGALVQRLPPRPFMPGALAFLGGDRLLVTCALRCSDTHRSEIWTIADADLQSTYQGHGPASYAVKVAPNGTAVAVSGGYDHEIHLWDSTTATPIRTLKGAGMGVTAVGIAPDGSTIGWGSETPCPDLNACPDQVAAITGAFPLPTGSSPFVAPRPETQNGAGLDRGRFEVADISLRSGPGEDRRHEHEVLEILQTGQRTALIAQTAETGYYHAGYTLTPEGKQVITAGSDGQMAVYDIDGLFVGAFANVAGHTDDVGSLAVAGAAPRLVSGSSDQTFKLWNVVTRKLIASFFVTSTDWIIWTPQGYYLSSPDGDRMIGWHVNQGRDRAARFVTVRQLRRHLHSPEIVRRAIVSGDPATAARELRGSDDLLAELLSRRPMEYSVRVLEELGGPQETARLEIRVENPDVTAPERFNVIVNDRMVADVTPRGVAGDGGASVQVIEVPVSGGANDILISAQDEQGFVTERGAFLLVNRGKESARGMLYLAVIGIQEFPLLPGACAGGPCDLTYPVADAAEFLRTVAEKSAPMFDRVQVLALASNGALTRNPLSAQSFAEFAPDVQEPDARTIDAELIDFLDLPGPEDTVMLFVAGHGINIDEDYYLLAADSRMQDDTRWKRSSLVDWRRIQEAMDRAVGRRIMVLDTCHAENACNPRLEKEAVDSRIVVFSATAANNTAAEMSQLGHGVFTYAMLEGLRGGAATDDAGVRLFGLADYVSREVVRLTSGRQEPFYHTGSTSNFVLALP